MTNNQLKILRAIHTAGETAYAYAISQETKIGYSVVSRALLRLSAEGLVKFIDSPPNGIESARERRYVAITEEGEKRLKRGW